MYRFAAALLLLSSLLAHASPQAGRDYLPIHPPVPSRDGMVVITEFFYYGCPECLELEPLLQEWASTRHDVRIVRIPAFRTAWLPLARTFYSLQLMGQEKRLRSRIFSAIQDRDMDLDNEDLLFAWLKMQDIDMEKFDSLYHSDLVEGSISDSMVLAKRLGISGVPSLVVDGRFLVLGNLARPGLLDQLVDMARLEKK